ncbi:hypothetical protein D915_004365 [Fasciola hepatica]|uniref:Transmembrane protein 59 n=1 Tax=Fasciola hepatica TaxID=6192 RepID=A0A4E0R7U5_FASHE|nr:hypothetical protein D915_004365 [Fasciola hepatica]
MNRKAVYAVLLSLCLASVLGVSDPAGNQLSQLEECNRKCEENYDAQLETVCQFGCRRADALRKVNDPEEDEQCRSACSSIYNVKTESDACNYGCSAYPKETKSVIGSLLNMMNGLLGNEAPKEIQNNTVSTPEEPHKIKIVVIRRFRIRLPDDEDSDPSDTMNSLFPESGPVILPPGDLMPSVGNDESISKLDSKEHELPQIINFKKFEYPSGQVSDALRYLGSHPLIILFSVTLLILCILLVVQLSLECRRRRRRAAQFQYNHFDQLPTYVEATTIKIPADGNPIETVDSDSQKV